MGGDGFHFSGCESGLILFPAHRFFPGGNIHHGDALVDRTHEGAKVATHTLNFLDLGHGLARKTTGSKSMSIG
jgi:hypothetical protein